MTISRCSNNYGPYHFPEKLIPLMISRALADEELPVYGKGENVRDWLHVSDHCEAIDLIIHKGKVGEIDIIAKEDQTLVFVEVKYRKDDKKGYPAQAVDQRKQQKIRKSAMIYLKKNHLSFEQPIRFDVVEILGKKIRVIKHAF